MAAIRENDMFFALRALSIMATLSRTECLVAGVLLAHFNRDTGQCDPSVERIGMLLGLGRSTVLAATASLSKGDDALFDKVSHGANSHRSQYTPRWGVFRKIVNEFDSKRTSNDSGPKVQEAGRSRSRKLDVEGPESWTQTLITNSYNKPIDSPECLADEQKQTISSPVSGSKRLLSGSTRPAYRSSSIRPQVAMSVSYGTAAREQANKRWTEALRRMDGDRYFRVIDHITEEIRDGADEAEMRRPGDGIMFLQSQLAKEFCNA